MILRDFRISDGFDSGVITFFGFLCCARHTGHLSLLNIVLEYPFHPDLVSSCLCFLFGINSAISFGVGDLFFLQQLLPSTLFVIFGRVSIEYRFATYFGTMLSWVFDVANTPIGFWFSSLTISALYRFRT